MFSQYSNFLSLYIYMILLIPAIVLGILGKRIKYYGILISIPCLFIIYVQSTDLSWNIKTYYILFQFLIYMAFQIILIKFFARYWKNNKNDIIYYLVLILSILPLFLIKAAPQIHKFNPDLRMDLVGFIGISYFSFRVWQIIIDIKDGNFEDRSSIDILYFISFFPTLSSGPIDRQRRFFKEVDSSIKPSDYVADYLMDGIQKIIMGIFYKFAIAAFINQYIIEKIPNLPPNYAFLSTFIYMYAYTIYLFFDFAGYTNFAIGTSYILGVKSPENFNKPFLARNMKEFWDRWHMSLSKWFGDYIFSRFMLNSLRSGRVKSRKIATRLAYMVTMTTMGIWHGFTIHYLIYGVYQGLMLVLTDIYLKSKIYKNFKNNILYTPISIIVCFQFISFGMLLFSGYLFN